MRRDPRNGFRRFAMSPATGLRPDHATALCEPRATGRGVVFRVLEGSLPVLREEIARLARRAERLGTAPLAMHETGDRDGEHVFVTLEGEPPTLAGWMIAAVVDHRQPVPEIRVVSSAPP